MGPPAPGGPGASLWEGRVSGKRRFQLLRGDSLRVGEGRWRHQGEAGGWTRRRCRGRGVTSQKHSFILTLNCSGTQDRKPAAAAIPKCPAQWHSARCATVPPPPPILRTGTCHLLSVWKSLATHGASWKQGQQHLSFCYWPILRSMLSSGVVHGVAGGRVPSVRLDRTRTHHPVRAVPPWRALMGRPRSCAVRLLRQDELLRCWRTCCRGFADGGGAQSQARREPDSCPGVAEMGRVGGVGSGLQGHV